MGSLVSFLGNAPQRPQLDSSPGNTTAASTSSCALSSTSSQPNTSTTPTPTPSPAASNPSSSSTCPSYTVFISHAGEDKATIAIPLRQKLNEKGISAFVDEEDMPPGIDAVKAITHAMETAKMGVIILSPEFVAKKWPMKELMHFLKRREDCLSEGDDGGEAPTILPCFYRLSVHDLYHESKLDRLDNDGKKLFEKWRFFERQKNGEPEADVEKIKASLTKLHGIMGVRNDVNANNDSSYVMSTLRETLLNTLCSKICECVPEGMRMLSSRDTARGIENNSRQESRFRRSFPPKLPGKKAVTDVDGRDAQDNPITEEGWVKHYLLEQGDCAVGVVSLHGLGGVGKSTNVEALMSDDAIRRYFPDGVHLIKLGSDATSNTLFEGICYILEESGADREVQRIRRRNQIEEALRLFTTWFARRRCVFFIDDVWERSVNLEALSRLCEVVSGGGGNRVMITTREDEIASITPETKAVHLRPRERRGEVARKILFFHAAIVEYEVDTTDKADTISKILDICAGLPVSLAVAEKNVRKLRMHMTGSTGEVWERYLSKLSTNRQRLLRENVGSYGNLYATFAASLEFLDEKCEEGWLGFTLKFSFAEMHRRLCVLQKQAAVPNTMLMHLWGTESEENADSIATMFVEVGLASYETMERKSDDSLRLTLHDSILDFAVSEAQHFDEISDAHKLLLDGYSSLHAEVYSESVVKKVKWWSQDVKADGYIHEHVCLHLAGSGQKKELCELLLTPL